MAKQVFSFETDREKDLETLGLARAFCNLAVEYGSCNPLHCANCETGKCIEQCMNELPACDRLKVQQITMFKEYTWRARFGKRGKEAVKESIKDIGHGLAVGLGAILLGGIILAIPLGVLALLWG